MTPPCPPDCLICHLKPPPPAWLRWVVTAVVAGVVGWSWVYLSTAASAPHEVPSGAHRPSTHTSVSLPEHAIARLHSHPAAGFEQSLHALSSSKARAAAVRMAGF